MAALFVLSAAGFCSQADGDVISAVGGLALGASSNFNDVKTPTPSLGVEYTFSIGSQLQLGGFFDRQFLQFTDSSVGSLSFMGVVARYHFFGSDHSGPFVYGKAGLGSMNTNSMNSNQKLSEGGGTGYQIVLSSVVSVSPRVGVSFLPD